MAAKSNGSKLEEAMALLIHNQAAFVAGHREHERDMAAFRREMIEMRGQLTDVIRVLNEHTQILEQHGKILAGLPEAVRERMGFKPETPSTVPKKQGS